ncbi:MAG TPA: sigma 54-interacting transcriptional regulator [Polyangium sp.]|nr:sigma 54-interacting transcriptional regulator [Polyangium sp.]
MSRGRLELVVFSWGDEPKRHSLPLIGEVRIGRDRRTNDISILDSSVSANHAILTVDSVLHLQDLGSTNGTILRKADHSLECTKTDRDGELRFSGETLVVEPGDRIVFGSVTTIVRTMLWPSNAQAGDGGTWPYAPVVRHPVMQALYDDARNVARSSSRACVLLLGETGVGKDVLARAIHAASPRAQGPFVAVNCPAIVESMFEREMFGHKKGTFTDAKADSPGYFEAADGGTLFLDEIGDLPMSLQAKLLRVLDDRRITRLGETQARLVDIRVIAATNRRLDECVVLGKFRRDLYYRLRGFELEIPPLRSRPADIVPLAQAFIEDECRATGQVFVPRLSDPVISILEGHDFPGNVRELRYAMMHAVAHCRMDVILSEHLPQELGDHKVASAGHPKLVKQISTDNSEKERLIWALHKSGGNHVRAAALLRISKRTLYNWLDRYQDLPRPRKGHS